MIAELLIGFLNYPWYIALTLPVLAGFIANTLTQILFGMNPGPPLFIGIPLALVGATAGKLGRSAIPTPTEWRIGIALFVALCVVAVVDRVVRSRRRVSSPE